MPVVGKNRNRLTNISVFYFYELLFLHFVCGRQRLFEPPQVPETKRQIAQFRLNHFRNSWIGFGLLAPLQSEQLARHTEHSKDVTLFG